MAEFTYPVIVKPMQSNSGVLGIEYWFPDFEECEHVFYPDINDDGAATDMTTHLFMLLTDRQNACDRRPTPKWYGADDYPPNAQLRFITVNTNGRSGYFAEKGEEKMRHGSPFSLLDLYNTAMCAAKKWTVRNEPPKGENNG